MPKITSAPSPSRFSDAWSKEFAKALDRAAGRDGRVSKNELVAMSKRSDGDQFYADDAIKMFDGLNQRTVAASRLKQLAPKYALDASKRVAGPDGRISFSEATDLPPTLIEDFFLLRGRALPGGPASEVDALRRSLETQVVGMTMPSETDAGFAFVSSANPVPAGPITEAMIREQLGAQHDALFGTIMNVVDPDYAKLSTKAFESMKDGDQWLKNYATPYDTDPSTVEQAQQFAALRAAMKAGLTDLKVVRFGEIEVSTFIVGRTRDGHLAGLLTGQVET